MPEDVRAVRKAMRAGKLKPTPKGVLVTGTQGPFTAPRTACEGHLWVTGKPVRNSNWRSGWCQGAKCIVCEHVLDPIDASWWIERPSEERIHTTMALIETQIARLSKISARLANYALLAEHRQELRVREVERALRR